MKRRFKVLITVLLIFVLLFAGIFGVANHYLNKINRTTDAVTVPAEQEFFETDGADDSLEVVDPDSINLDSDLLTRDEGLINVLLVGQDRRDGEGRQRADALILCSFNPENNKLSMISFLRDLYVKIPGYSDNRLNAAYIFGGFPLLKETFLANFGISIDGCFEVDFNGFEKVIDIIGGIDIELTSDEAKVIGGGTHSGTNRLNGKQALDYARIRKLDSDFGRTARQRNVLKAAFNKIKDRGVSELLSLVDTVLPMITTDLSNFQITSLAVKYAPALAGLQITTQFVPEKGCYREAKVRGMSVLIPDITGIRKLLNEEYLPLD